LEAKRHRHLVQTRLLGKPADLWVEASILRDCQGHIYPGCV